LSNIDELRNELLEIKNSGLKIINLKDVEKFMINKLDVVRIKTGKGPGKKKGKGSVITYFSKIKKENEHDGHFTIHKFHKKKEEITKIDFKRYLYPVLDRILNYMEQQ